MGENGLMVRGSADLATTEAGGRNPAAVYLAALAPTGRRTMRGVLERVAEMAGDFDLETMPWAALRYEHVAALSAHLAETLAPATVNKYLSAVRGVLRVAWRMEQLTADEYQRAKDIDPVRGEALPAGRAVRPGELAALMRACDDGTDAGKRDAAIIALGYAGGLRRAELAALDLASVEDDDGETVTLRLTGKGQRERLVYIDNGAYEALRAWVRVRGGDPGPLFYRGRRGGHIEHGAGMTPQAIRDVVTRRAAAAGVANVTPHDLRRSFVSDLLDAGADLATVAAMAGHANVETTRRYDRRGEGAKRKAAKSLHVPYYGK